MGFWEIVIFLIKWPPDAPKDAVFFTLCDKNRFWTKNMSFHHMPREAISDLPDHVNTRFETFYPNCGFQGGPTQNGHVGHWSPLTHILAI